MLDLKVELSEQSVRNLLREELQMSYRSLHRSEIHCNTVKSKQKRQLAASLYAKELAKSVEIINIDESLLD